MELTDAQRERIAAGKQWLAQVREESADQLNARLADYEASLNDRIHGLTNDQLTFLPSPDHWSIRQVCLHITHSVRTVAIIVSTLAGGKDGPEKIAMGLMDDDHGDNEEELSRRLREAFQLADDATRLLDGNFNNDQTTDHPFFGALNCKEWAVFNLMHVSIHIQQIDRIKNDSSYPA